MSDRLSKALKRSLQLQALGVSVGVPRFKTPNRWHSIQWRQYALSRDVWLEEEGEGEDRTQRQVPAKLGKVRKIKLHRPLQGTPVTAHLVWRAENHGYARIGCETDPQDEQGIVPPERMENARIGLLAWMWG